MDDPLSLTALVVAAVRAKETDRSDALFSDTLAGILAGSEGREIVALLEESLLVTATLPIRTRFFDDRIKHLTSHHSIKQLTLLAAGMDTEK